MRVAVFLGSRAGTAKAFQDAAEALGLALAEAGIGLVYGGAAIGLMGIVADAALSRGGEVIGVLPRSLSGAEIAHGALSRLHIVESLQERKTVMAAMADGFVALPGGIGTMDELFEMWTWTQLGYQAKPCGILNVEGFYDHLIAQIETFVSNGFLTPSERDVLIHEKDIGPLISRLAARIREAAAR